MTTQETRIEKAKTLAMGAVVGAIALAVVGSFWPGWSLESTIKKRVADTERATMVAALAPVCAQKFRNQPDVVTKAAELKGVSSWQRDRHMVAGNYVMKSGLAATDEAVGGACARLLEDLLK